MLELFWATLRFHDPVLSHHLEGLEIASAMLAVPWFATLFTSCFPVDTSVEVLDRFILSSSDNIPVLYAVGLLLMERDQLLSISDQSHMLVWFARLNNRNESYVGPPPLEVARTAQSIDDRTPEGVFANSPRELHLVLRQGGIPDSKTKWSIVEIESAENAIACSALVEGLEKPWLLVCKGPHRLEYVKMVYEAGVAGAVILGEDVPKDNHSAPGLNDHTTTLQRVRAIYDGGAGSTIVRDELEDISPKSDVTAPIADKSQMRKKKRVKKKKKKRVGKGTAGESVPSQQHEGETVFLEDDSSKGKEEDGAD